MLFILLSGAGLSGCSQIGEQPTDKGPKRELPLAEYRDTTILDMYEGSRLSWVLKTKYLVKWPRTEMVRARPVNLVVYDSLGKVLVRVTSDSGAVDEGISFLVASGHVHGHSEKGVDITSDSLRWNKAINQISTDARVRVISEDGDILTGKGFISDAKLDNWQILSDVKGVFQKVEERFQHADSSGTPKSSDSSSKAPEAVIPSPPAAPGAIPGHATDTSVVPKPAATPSPSPAAPSPAVPAIPAGAAR
ncbi:MAG: LPS export ABC transporter periplasmic protein LptC [Fibrobacteria bacterium]